MESAMSGLMAAMHLTRRLEGKEPVVPEDTCVCGALSRYIAAPARHFQPMNANYGILRGLDERDKIQKKRRMAERALQEIERVRALVSEQ